MLVKDLGVVSYLDSQKAMQEFVASAGSETEDELWLLEHEPVYTQGTACKLQTLLPSDIPVVKSDRGGQITYHGPGQIIMYTLMNLKKNRLGVKALVDSLEQAVINLLEQYGINAQRKENAPGVYVDDTKIAALGLRVKKGFSYHGLSLNVNMNLAPFKNIDPCGYQGLKVSQLSDYNVDTSLVSVKHQLVESFQKVLEGIET